MDKCEIKYCCCKCVSHRPAHKHCHAKKPCKCGDRIGWVCVGEDQPSSRVFVNWSEHSCGCELHTTKSEYDALMKKEAKR